jgi:hypothetical protein
MYVTLFRVLTSYSVNKNIDRCITLGRFVIKSSTDERLTQIKRLLVRHTRKKRSRSTYNGSMVQHRGRLLPSFPLRRVSSLMIVVVAMIALLTRCWSSCENARRLQWNSPKGYCTDGFQNQPQTYLTESNVLCVCE